MMSNEAWWPRLGPRGNPALALKTCGTFGADQRYALLLYWEHDAGRELYLCPFKVDDPLAFDDPVHFADVDAVLAAGWIVD